MNWPRTAASISIAAVLGTAGAVAQGPARPDPLGKLAPLIGRWEGTAEGQPGKGIVRREYSRALNGRFIRAANRSEYEPTGKHPKGENHEDEGLFSFDRARGRIVFRQFHVEGFVNTYLEDAESTASTLVFTTEAIENIPAGFRARETYVMHGPDEVEEIFEMAEPGKPFAVYSRTRLTRVK